MGKKFFRKSDLLYGPLAVHKALDRKIRNTLGLTGKNVKSKLGLRMKPVNSAATLYSSDVYGPTGSIVGRY